MTWPWNGISSVNGTQLTPLYSLSVRSRRAVGARRSGHDVADAHREHDLRLVVEVAAERVGTDAGGPQQLRGAQGVGGDHHEPRPHGVRLARCGRSRDLDAGSTAVLDEHPGDERLVVEGEVRVRAGRVAEHDVRARPHQAAVVAAVHGQRHPLHARRRRRGPRRPRRRAARARAARTASRRRRRVVTPSSRSASVEQLVEVGRGSAMRSLPPGRGHAPVQCAAMPPTLLDIAATGRPSSPSTW